MLGRRDSNAHSDALAAGQPGRHARYRQSDLLGEMMDRSVTQTGKRNAKLLATVTANEMGRRTAHIEVFRQSDQNPVSRGMAESVVDGLEMIGVDHDEGEAAPRGKSAGQKRLGLFEEGPAVEAAGQGVTRCEIAQRAVLVRDEALGFAELLNRRAQTLI